VRCAVSQIRIGGTSGQQGTYLLHIRINRDLRLRYRRGARSGATLFPGGDYVYVGSALGSGATALPGRLLRHASRSGARPAHRIHGSLLRALRDAGMAGTDQPRGAKRRHWHIDYLLDAAGVRLVGVLAVRSPLRLEDDLASHLQADPECRIVVAGFGAGDAPGATHLFAVPADPVWWDRLGRHATSLPPSPAYSRIAAASL
jgi:Uri superfamily endonuclease